jgi:hypothetical protein
MSKNVSLKLSFDDLQLSFDEVALLRAVLYEYYSENDYMCNDERKTHQSLEEILADAEDSFVFE